MNQALSQRCTTPATGRGTNAVLKGCLIPTTPVCRIVFNALCPELLDNFTARVRHALVSLKVSAASKMEASTLLIKASRRTSPIQRSRRRI